MRVMDPFIPGGVRTRVSVCSKGGSPRASDRPIYSLGVRTRVPACCQGHSVRMWDPFIPWESELRYQCVLRVIVCGVMDKLIRRGSELEFLCVLRVIRRASVGPIHSLRVRSKVSVCSQCHRLRGAVSLWSQGHHVLVLDPFIP